MTQSFLLGAYWSARNETLEQCTERLGRLLHDLAEVDESLATWYQRGRSRKDALAQELSFCERTQIIAILEKGRNRRDIGNEVIEDLGFRIGLWNGAIDQDLSSSLGVHCGAYGPHVGNSVTLSLPAAIVCRLGAEKIEYLLSLTCEIWQPEWAGVMSKQAMQARNFSGRRPFVDWMVYVPRTIHVVPPFATVMPVQGLGSIVTVQPEPPWGVDPEELRRIGQVEAAISI